MTDEMAELPFPRLRKGQQRGSKPRCHLFTSGCKEEVANRLTAMIAPFGRVLADDSWMPDGFLNCEEAQLHCAERLIPDSVMRARLSDWWLAARGPRTTTPNWDIASTCIIDGRRGLLLIEAKAHEAELRNEERGKMLGSDNNEGVSIESRRNHVRIGACIEEASLALSGETHLAWALSRDWNYQMANRFTWAWKLAELGTPVILVYLGFGGCEEMRRGNDKPFSSSREWQELVEHHSEPLFPLQVWNTKWTVHAQAFIPLIRFCEQPLRLPGATG